MDKKTEDKFRKDLSMIGYKDADYLQILSITCRVDKNHTVAIAR